MPNYFYHMPIHGRVENTDFSMRVARRFPDEKEAAAKTPSRRNSAPRCAVIFMYLALGMRFALLSDANAATFPSETDSLSGGGLAERIVAYATYFDTFLERGGQVLVGNR